MNPTIQVKLDDFNAAIADMQSRLGNARTQRSVIDNEVGKIIEKTLAGTKTATRASINDSLKKTEWTTIGGRHWLLTNRYPDRIWAMIQEGMAASLARKVAAIGWARKSWYALAKKLGLSINSKGSEMATVRGHDADENVTYRRDESQGNYLLVIANTSPLLRYADSDRAFFGAVAGRTAFYRQNLAHGVFNDFAEVAKKYPGLNIIVPPRAD